MFDPLPTFDSEKALLFAALLLGLGLVGVLRRRNMVFVMMALELVFAAPVVAMIALSHHVRTWNGEIFAVFIIMIAAAQAAVAVALIVSMYRHRRSISTGPWNELKG